MGSCFQVRADTQTQTQFAVEKEQNKCNQCEDAFVHKKDLKKHKKDLRRHIYVCSVSQCSTICAKNSESWRTVQKQHQHQSHLKIWRQTNNEKTPTQAEHQKRTITENVQLVIIR